jgi:pantoate--beta-alanine ligase
MLHIETISELRAECDRARAHGRRVGLVPTMGYLHEGHRSLMRAARAECDFVVVTIFVNPLQFGAGEDLDRYPRQEKADARMLKEAGCDLLWLPSASDIYPAGFATQVRVTGLSDHWEGAVRPGHFEGVATVVAKLLLAVGPDIAVFGEKDFQQLAVIRRLVRDLNIATEIVGVPTVRDPDGLALSSRNAYLSEAERRQALALPRALKAARAALLSGSAVAEVLEEARNSLLGGGFSRVDYFALVDPETLAPSDDLKDGARLIAAAAMGSTRLIDNLPV